MEVKVYLYFFNFDARRSWLVSVRTRPFYSQEKGRVLLLQDEAWAQVPVWTSAENLAPHGISIPERPARKEALHHS